MPGPWANGSVEHLCLNWDRCDEFRAGAVMLFSEGRDSPVLEDFRHNDRVFFRARYSWCPVHSNGAFRECPGCYAS
jgi:hypothetical protein